ncbi:putative restriction endonuclease [Streptomyces sp. 846.5]|nr:Uma2 family endonuclease [Streptomyces sp. 846.5]TDU06281.1 putative restriction endonuclease [Streptomyces sp. 846.5]
MTEQSIYQHLREFAEHFEPPAPFGPHIEISDGKIVMMISPSGAHDLDAMRVTNQLARQLPAGLFAGGFDIEHPLAAKMRRPDVAVVDEDAAITSEAVDATAVHLAVEIVSPSNPENDYIDKVRDYPLMGVPRYLIVDPRNGACLYYWDSDGKTYRQSLPYTFGDVISVGDWTIDTSELVLYPPKRHR